MASEEMMLEEKMCVCWVGGGRGGSLFVYVGLVCIYSTNEYGSVFLCEASACCPIRPEKKL